MLDGDTVDLFVDMGLELFATVRVNLSGLDAPELGGVTAQPKKAKMAKKKLKEILKSFDPSNYVIVYFIAKSERGWEAVLYWPGIPAKDRVPSNSVNMEMHAYLAEIR